MKLEKLKKHYIMALAIMFVVVSLSDTTYSLFFKAESTGDFNYNTGNLDLQITEDEQIQLQNAFPIIDSEALKNDAYKLTIKNTGTLPYLFDLKMLSSTEENVIDSKYIKFQVDNNKSNNLYNASNIIASNIMLYPNEEKTFNIKIWLDINTPNTELGKTFIAKLATNGEATYKTLDVSGANHPNLIDDMIPVYYDETEETWKKADASNINELYEWYNYDNKKWANTITIKSSNKKIYDITGRNDLNISEARTNNRNFITDENYLDIGLSNYEHNKISNIFRIKFNELEIDKTYIITNEKMSYYYDNKIKKFIFKLVDKTIESDEYNIEKDTWYILGYTYDSNKITFYVNGNNLSSSNLTGNISTNKTFKVGTNETLDKISNLEIGDIYIYNNILNEEEIKENYRETINIIYDNLIAGYNDFEPKTLKEYYLSSNLGTKIDNEDISKQYVWIPRFKYKLWNVTGTLGTDSYNAFAKGIDIVFENQTESSGIIKCENNICYSDSLLITKVTNNDNGKYYTHPAFTNESGEVTGLWVSKYEISTNSSECNNTNTNGCTSSNLEIESKLGNTAWRNNYLSNFYQNIKKLDQNNNYHVIKNTEWGAITYLSYSKYGLCQSNRCNRIGANDTYISGNKTTDSTTSNIYGVFDLAGSASEFVMANYTNDLKNINLTNTHFGNIEINKFDYDLYTKDTFILGDATLETTLKTGSWYNEQSKFVDETNTWIIRGGIASTNNTGIFHYNSTTDNPNRYISTRIVIK